MLWKVHLTQLPIKIDWEAVFPQAMQYKIMIPQLRHNLIKKTRQNALHLVPVRYYLRNMELLKVSWAEMP